MSAAARWTTDILGPAWAAHTIDLGSDTEGPVTATLVRRSAGPRHSHAVLYIHGFVDYFFQEHEAAFFEQLGFDFYAIDLRKYGRSLRPGQTANFVDNLSDYRAELDVAATIITAEGHEDFVVLGHSTGGLIAALWASARTQQTGPERPAELGRISAVILNSPWFDLNKPWLMRTAGSWLVTQLARIAPMAKVAGLAPHYGRALHRETGGEWDYDLTLKPHEGFPVRAAWFATIRASQARVAHGLNIACPVLVLASDRSGDPTHNHPEVIRTDSVLNVDHIRKGAAHLGEDVTFVPIAGGAHDLALSPEPARSAYFDAIALWLGGLVPTT